MCSHITESLSLSVSVEHIAALTGHSVTLRLCRESFSPRNGGVRKDSSLLLHFVVLKEGRFAGALRFDFK